MGGWLCVSEDDAVGMGDSEGRDSEGNGGAGGAVVWGAGGRRGWFRALCARAWSRSCCLYPSSFFFISNLSLSISFFRFSVSNVLFLISVCIWTSLGSGCGVVETAAAVAVAVAGAVACAGGIVIAGGGIPYRLGIYGPGVGVAGFIAVVMSSAVISVDIFGFVEFGKR